MAGVTPLDIWTALRQQGASPVQAAGIMGNMIHESSLDPEAAAMDSNGYYSYGLNQWNAASHPQASSLVTGNPVADLKAQVSYLIASGGLAAAAGSTPADAGASFAHTYERCAACGYQGGSSELAVRAASANAVYAAQQSGNWGGITAGVAPAPYTIVGSKPGETGVQADPSAFSDPSAVGNVGCHAADSGGTNCIINLPGSFCITRCELKAVKGALVLVAGGALFMVGGLIIAAYGLKASGLSKAAGQAAQPVRKVAQTVPPSARVLTEATSRARAPARARRSEGRDLRGSLARGEVAYPQQETPFDEGDRLFERSRGSRASNRAFYRRTMSDTSDLQRRTA